jgi:general bacterial porin, GBP family
MSTSFTKGEKMKLKKLFIVGLLSAVAGIASAQSTVIVYGILDVNMSSSKNDGAGTNTAMSENSLYTSRLGFKGAEDLGGGLKAEFQLESRLLPSTGVAGQGTTTTANSELFNREAWVGLSSTTLGSIRLGTTDVSGAANIDFYVSQAGNLAIATTQFGVDQNKVVRYITPVFNGFSAEVGYANPDATTTTENTTNSIKSTVVQYKTGKLAVYAGLETKKIDSTHAQDHKIFGATYDFGIGRVGAYYGVKDGATSTTANTGEVKQTRVSAAMPLSQGYTAHVVYLKDQTATQSDTDFDGYKLAVTKAFSKRTTGYVTYGVTNYVTTTADNQTYIIGLNHKF